MTMRLCICYMKNMSKLVITNIRLTKDELLEYRLMALNEEKSFSEYIRTVMKQFARQKKASEEVDVSASLTKSKADDTNSL